MVTLHEALKRYFSSVLETDDNYSATLRAYGAKMKEEATDAAQKESEVHEQAWRRSGIRWPRGGRGSGGSCAHLHQPEQVFSRADWAHI